MLVASPRASEREPAVIIYVETNFVLELALTQEEHAECRRILNLAGESEAGVELALPAASIVEAYESLERKTRRRRTLHRALLEEAGQLSRSGPYAERSEELREAMGVLPASIEGQERALDAALEEVVSRATILPLDRGTFARAARYRETLDLDDPQDALGLASVVADLEQRASRAGASCFLTRNPKDFADDDVRAELEILGCKPLFTFRAGLAYARGPS